MVDISNNKFKYITDKNNKPEESFVNLYVNKCFESNNAKSPTRRMRKLLDAKYEKADFNEVMNKQCQKKINCYGTSCTSIDSEEVRRSV